MTNQQGDSLTLTIPGLNEGLMVANVAEPSRYNKWALYSKSNGISVSSFNVMQSVFEYLVLIDK